MQIKGTESIHVSFTAAGKIAIEQWSSEHGEPVCIYITLDQFKEIDRWADENYLEILEAWNGGVEDEQS